MYTSANVENIMQIDCRVAKLCLPSWHLIADSSSLLSWDLWQKIFLCLWTHCLELTTTIRQ